MTQRRPSSLAVIDGQPVNVATLDDAVAKAARWAKMGVGFTLFTLNLDHLVKRRADWRFSDAYARATFVTVDGAPVVRLAERQGAKIDRATGADMIVPLCRAAAFDGVPVFLFGSSETTLAKAADVLRRQCPGLDIRGTLAPPQGFNPVSVEAEAAGVKIAASGARLCFVALGAPKQEVFADRMAAKGWPVGWVCIGAALDFLAGEQIRAPKPFRVLGIEWTWRLLTDPRRMTLRYARCALLFARLLLAGSGRPKPPVQGQPRPA